jgi:hypothetical protein
MKILPFRRSLRVMVLLATLLVVSLCAPELPFRTSVQVDISAQPQGGLYVNTISCTYNGTATNTVGTFGHAIYVLSYWHSSDGEVLSNTGEQMIFTSLDQHTATITVTKSAPSGMYLDKNFWCVIDWTDVDGSHTLVSDTAHCRVQ